MTLQDPKTYVFDLDREVAKFYRTHPEQKNKVFFIDASRSPAKLIRNEPDRPQILAILNKNDDIGEEVAITAKRTSRSVHYLNSEQKVIATFIMLNTPRDIKAATLGYDTLPDIEAIFAFDHELGHALYEQGQNEETAESVGDAYAIIRHFQRFRRSTALRNLAASRAVEGLLQEGGFHFTSPVVEALLAENKNNFRKLSRQGTSDMVQAFAESAAPHPIYARNFAAKINTLETPPGTSLIQAIADCILHDLTPEEFKWGSVALRALLQGDIVWNGSRFTPNDPVWARKTLRQIEKTRRSIPP